MDMQRGVRKRHKKNVFDSVNELYIHDLQMYSVPPNNEILLSEFEDLALERVQVLRIIEQATHMGHKIYTKEWKDSIVQELHKEHLMKYYHLLHGGEGCKNHNQVDVQARRADHISHFILRLAYCRSDELRRWFLARELELFKLRFLNLNSEGLDKFLQLNNLTYKPISNDKKNELREKLQDSTAGVNAVDIINFYRVAFEEVCPLVKNKKVYVERGFAFIPGFELITCVLSLFRANLNEALAYANLRIPSLDDDRLIYLLSSIHTSYIGNDYSAQYDTDRIDIANIDMYARTHFPLCMRSIHESFRATHHMKFVARFQYGLFLKGIGVLYEDCLKFWRNEFLKIMDENEFKKKQYEYAIKHNYGLVGRQVSYTPQSCIKIINASVGAGEHHGCPFRHWDVDSLKRKMAEYGISDQGTQEVIELAKSGHYQIACGKYFECTQGEPPRKAINHPNQYFEASFAISKPEVKGSASLVKPKTAMDTSNVQES